MGGPPEWDSLPLAIQTGLMVSEGSIEIHARGQPIQPSSDPGGQLSSGLPIPRCLLTAGRALQGSQPAATLLGSA